jgi:hypothetical protein
LIGLKKLDIEKLTGRSEKIGVESFKVKLFYLSHRLFLSLKYLNSDEVGFEGKENDFWR